MGVERLRTRDDVTARVLSAGSAVAQRFPIVNKFVGGSNDPLYRPVRWHHAWPDRGSSTVTNAWLDFAAEPSSGMVRPRSFASIAQLSIDKTAFHEQQLPLAGQQAVAYRIGSQAVLAGVNQHSPYHELFGDDPNDSDRYAMGMRVGRGVLHAAIGVYVPHDGYFVPIHDDASRGSVTSYEENRVPFV